MFPILLFSNNSYNVPFVYFSLFCRLSGMPVQVHIICVIVYDNFILKTLHYGYIKTWTLTETVNNEHNTAACCLLLDFRFARGSVKSEYVEQEWKKRRRRKMSKKHMMDSCEMVSVSVQHHVCTLYSLVLLANKSKHWYTWRQQLSIFQVPQMFSMLNAPSFIWFVDLLIYQTSQFLSMFFFSFFFSWCLCTV